MRRLGTDLGAAADEFGVGGFGNDRVVVAGIGFKAGYLEDVGQVAGLGDVAAADIDRNDAVGGEEILDALFF